MGLERLHKIGNPRLIASGIAEGASISLEGENVGEKGIADLRIAIPVEYGVDRLRQLGAARLVDTARVDPDVAVTIAMCDLTCSSYFLRAP